jgi:hypothetical protein
MGKPKAPLADKMRSARLILAGRSTPTKEALKYNVTPQAVEQWVKAYEKKKSPSLLGGEAAPPSDGAVTPSPAAGAPPVKADGALEAALAAAGVERPAALPAAPSIGQDIAEARAEDEKFCLEALGGAKQTIGNLACAFYFNLPSSDPKVEALTRLGPVATEAIKANASLIAPDLRKHLSMGWGAVGLALGIDAVLSFVALRRIALERGTLKRKEKAKPEAEAVEPAYAEAPTA